MRSLFKLVISLAKQFWMSCLFKPLVPNSQNGSFEDLPIIAIQLLIPAYLEMAIK
jgi:hypothetical protein